MTLPRTLALDVGNRRIGVALSDALGIAAHPLLTIYRTTLTADLKSIARLVRKHGVTAVLVGLPVHASGDASAQSAKTERFAEALRAHLLEKLEAPPRIVLLDERHTTREAHALLDRKAGPPRTQAAREERTKLIDQAAACVLLESWLRQQAPALLPDPEGQRTEE